MIQRIQGVGGIVLALLSSLACPGPAMSQGKQPAEDPVHRAVREYRTKVDDLERRTKQILTRRQQQLDEAAAVQRELTARNAQLNTLVAELRDQLAAADAERHRLQRSQEKREVGSRGTGNAQATGKAAKTEKVEKAVSWPAKERVQQLEDRLTSMEGSVRRLRREVQTLLRQSATRNRAAPGATQGDTHIHIHIHGGAVNLHFGGGAQGERHENDDSLVGELHKER